MSYEPQDRYPVIVEETRRYVVWVEADDQEEAVGLFEGDPSDPGHDAMYGFDWEASAPDKWDWREIERPAVNAGGWLGMQADAHVQTHRNYLAWQRQQAKKAACVAAGHPIPDDASGPLTWADYCGTCGPIEPGARTAVPAGGGT